MYNENTDLILGEELMLYVKSGATLTPLAFATSHTLSLSADTIDTSNKFSGQWKAAKAGQIGWTISAEALLSRTAGHMSFETLAAMMAKRQAIEVVIATPVAGTFAAGTNMVSGEALITSLDKKADRGAICTSSITLQGSGALNGSDGSALGDESAG